jgi:2-methylisocitrate lyase-like PEP mutase family enzyme
MNAPDLEELGFSLVIFPGGIVRAMAATARDYYQSLISSGSNDAFRNRMFDFAGLNDVIGTPETLAEGKLYEEAVN